jgi:hypothetical protein
MIVNNGVIGFYDFISTQSLTYCIEFLIITELFFGGLIDDV